MSWRIRHLTSDGEKGFGIASRYACLVCGCVVAARVLAPLRLDEELWWFYALVCGGVLFGPLLGVLPQSWHGEASPWQLAVARVVLMVLFLQHEQGSGTWYARPIAPAWYARPVAPGVFHNIKTGLPVWTGAERWDAKWLHISAVEHAALRVAAALALLGVCAQPALLLTGVLHAREHMLAQSLRRKVDHGSMLWLPLLLVFALSPCADALALGPWLWRRTTGRAAPPPRRPAEYALSFTAVWLLLATTYLTAGFAKAVNCSKRNGGELSSAFWNSTHFRDMMHAQYFSKCNGAQCQDPSHVSYQPLCTRQISTMLRHAGAAGFPALHSSCLLGDDYLFPWLRPDQMLPPWVLHLAALGAMVWECGMWLCVLRPGPLCALGLLAGFMFHQSVRWSTSISFNDQQDVYLLSLPLLLGRLRGPGGTHEPARRDSTPWDTRWLVAAFAFSWGCLHVSPSNLRQGSQYPIGAFPAFCAGRSHGSPTQPQHGPRTHYMITDVKLTSCVSGSLLKRGALVPRRWVELHGKDAAMWVKLKGEKAGTGRCSSAFWRDLTQAVQMEHGLGNRGSAVCALFFVQRFALLPGTPLEAQLRRDPPARLVRVNGTVVSAKAGSASAWSSCAGPSPSASRNHAAVQKRPPHAAASAPASRNHTAVHKGPPHAPASTNSNASSSPVDDTSPTCVGNIKSGPVCCAAECGTCGGTGCSKYAEGFTCCKGEILDTCTSPHQHTCRIERIH